MSETSAPQPPVFVLEKLYVKDVSVEIPNAPTVFLESDTPKIEFGLGSAGVEFAEGRYEVTVTITAVATREEKNVFLIEATQAGIFQMHNIPQADMEYVVSVVCPNMLYPYLRATISDLSVRAGFAPVLLTPLNFDTLYREKKAQKSANLMPEQTPATTH